MEDSERQTGEVVEKEEEGVVTFEGSPKIRRTPQCQTKDAPMAEAPGAAPECAVTNIQEMFQSEATTEVNWEVADEIGQTALDSGWALLTAIVIC